jgi:hypothetical protein
MDVVQYFFQGLWDLVWHWGLMVGISLCGFAIMWFTPFKKLGLVIGYSAGLALLAYSLGVIDERHHWQAAEQRTLSVEQRARTDAVNTVDKPDGVRNDKYDRRD